MHRHIKHKKVTYQPNRHNHKNSCSTAAKPARTGSARVCVLGYGHGAYPPAATSSGHTVTLHGGLAMQPPIECGDLLPWSVWHCHHYLHTNLHTNRATQPCGNLRQPHPSNMRLRCTRLPQRGDCSAVHSKQRLTVLSQGHHLVNLFFYMAYAAAGGVMWRGAICQCGQRRGQGGGDVNSMLP